MSERPNREPMLVLENLCQAYPSADGRPQEILKGVSLTVASGELLAIVGPSGGGKSCLLRLLNRLEEPCAGTVRLQGEQMAGAPPVQWRRRIALVPQQPIMFAGTVLDNLQRPFLYRNQPLPLAADAGLRQTLELCQLEAELLPRQAVSLSGGQRQRLSLARALLSQPQVLLLDEPTSALDRPASDRFAATLHSICRQQQLAVLVVSHDLRFAERVADRLVFLDQGLVVEQGAVVQFFGQPQTEALQRFLAGVEAEGGHD